MIRQTTKLNRTTTEIIYALTSLLPDMASPSRLINLIRDYWKIENRLHSRRDVTLGEAQHNNVSLRLDLNMRLT